MKGFREAVESGDATAIEGLLAEGVQFRVLVFEARVGDRRVEGADFLHVDAEGLIDDFRVMVRPLSGLSALVEGMQLAIPEVMAELGLDG